MFTAPDKAGDATAALQDPGELHSNDIIIFPLDDRSTTGKLAGLHSCDCFAVSFPKSHWKRQPSADQAAFEVEPWIPIDADAMAIDVIDSPDCWLAVATRAEPLRAMVASERANGCRMVAAVPLVMLTAAPLIRSARKHRTTTILVSWNDSVDLITLRRGLICGWQWLSNNPSAVETALRHRIQDEVSTDLDSTANWILINPSPEIETSVRSLSSNAALQVHCYDLLHEAGLEANRIINGTQSPYINVNRGCLSPAEVLAPFRTPLLALFASLSLLAMTIIGLMVWKTAVNEKQISSLQDRQSEIFNDLFPGQSAPVGLLVRLESEHRKLQATRGRSENFPQVGSVTSVYHAFLSGTPKDRKFRWDRIEFISNRIFQASGTAKTFNDYEAVGASLKKAGFQIPALSAAQVAGGVSMRLDDVAHIENPSAATKPGNSTVSSNEVLK